MYIYIYLTTCHHKTLYYSWCSWYKFETTAINCVSISMTCSRTAIQTNERWIVCIHISNVIELHKTTPTPFFDLNQINVVVINVLFSFFVVARKIDWSGQNDIWTFWGLKKYCFLNDFYISKKRFDLTKQEGSWGDKKSSRVAHNSLCERHRMWVFRPEAPSCGVRT